MKHPAFEIFAKYNRDKSFLSTTERALLAVAMFPQEEDQDQTELIKIVTGETVSRLDFEDIDWKLAVRLTDEDLHQMLVLLDSVTHLKDIRLTRCENMTGSGLIPLWGSKSIEVIVLDLKPVVEYSCLKSPSRSRISETDSLPVLMSIVDLGRNSSLKQLQLPEDWSWGKFPIKLRIPQEHYYENITEVRARALVGEWTRQLRENRLNVKNALDKIHEDDFIPNALLCNEIDTSFIGTISLDAASILASFLKESFDGGRSIASGVVNAIFKERVDKMTISIFVESDVRLTQLCFFVCVISFGGFKHILRYIQDCPGLKHLLFVGVKVVEYFDNQRRVKLEDVVVQRICGALTKGGVKLANLAFDSCGVTSEGAKQIARYLGDCQGLKYLNLDDNDLNDEGVKCIVEALGPGCAIEDIELSGCSFGMSGARALIDAFGPDGIHWPRLCVIGMSRHLLSNDVREELERVFLDIISCDPIT